MASLAERFGFPNTPDMQDWEWEVADSSRIDEFLAAYESGELDEDEQFTLMETIIQSFEDLDADLGESPNWRRTLELLEDRIDVHIYSIWYWADLEEHDIAESWVVTPWMRKILEPHRARFESPPGNC